MQNKIITTHFYDYFHSYAGMINILLRLLLIYIPVFYFSFENNQLNLWITLIFCIEISLHPHRLLQQVFLRQIRKNEHINTVLKRFFCLYFFSAFIPSIYSFFFITEFDNSKKLLICILIFFLSFVQIFSNFPRAMLKLSIEQKNGLIVNFFLLLITLFFLLFISDIYLIFCFLIFILCSATLIISYLSDGNKIYYANFNILRNKDVKENNSKELLNFIVGSIFTTLSLMLFVFLWKKGFIVDSSKDEFSFFILMNSATQLAYYFFSSNLPRMFALRKLSEANILIEKNLKFFTLIFLTGQVILFLLSPHIFGIKINFVLFLGYLISLLSLRFTQVILTQQREHGNLIFFEVGSIFFIFNILFWSICYFYGIKLSALEFIIYYSFSQLIVLLFYSYKFNVLTVISKFYFGFIFSSFLFLLL